MSEEEHELLFDFLWNLGNKERETNIQIQEMLKQKMIENRHNLLRYDMVTVGHIDGGIISDIITNCPLNEIEESELWAIFHKLRHDSSTRDSDQINRKLGTYNIIENKLKMVGKINVLDIGCGKNGNGISTLTARYLGKIKGYGIDLDIQDHPSNVNLIRASAEKLPFRDNFFEVIYSSNVIYYFEGKRLISVIKEILRVLKSGGLFIFDEMNRGFDEYNNIIVPSTGIKAEVIRGKYRILIIKKINS